MNSGPQHLVILVRHASRERRWCLPGRGWPVAGAARQEVGGVAGGNRYAGEGQQDAPLPEHAQEASHRPGHLDKGPPAERGRVLRDGDAPTPEKGAHSHGRLRGRVLLLPVGLSHNPSTKIRIP